MESPEFHNAKNNIYIYIYTNKYEYINQSSKVIHGILVIIQHNSPSVLNFGAFSPS